MSKKTAILWLRHDFRFYDNEALKEGCGFDELVPIFVWDDSPQDWQPGGASKWWLHQSLREFKERLVQAGSDLILRKGPTTQEIELVVKATNATAVLCNRSYDPTETPKVKALMQRLQELRVEFHALPGNLIDSPEALLKKDKTPYLVYTPFWKNFIAQYSPKSSEKPKKLPPLPKNAGNLSVSLEIFKLLPKLSWHEAFHDHWAPGESQALKRAKQFLKEGLTSYQDKRDLPATQGTSRLSPYLHFGEIHPQRILSMVAEEHGRLDKIQDPNILQFLKEILWREFSYHLLQHFPKTPTEPLRESYKAFPWKHNKVYFEAWTKGQTGYPIVDAGMRELWQTGWMHNRVRMITASFLVKHLHIHWLDGARWFWDTLVDADLASNTQGWQWTSGCGADAAPFFRIFNPITQGETFDPEGRYVMRWCPELARLPPKWIYKPWQAPERDLRRAGVELGVNYPLPIVDHKEARAKALANFATLQNQTI